MVAGGKGEVVVMVKAGFTVSENGPKAVPPAASVTVAVKLTGVVDVGVPDSSPLVLIVSQVGSSVVVQVYGATPVPVVTANCCK
jgi:hypothetical protein